VVEGGDQVFKKIEQTNKDFKGRVRLFLEAKGGQGRLISSRNTRGLIAPKTQNHKGGG
jgi:hypothetical protein